MMYIYLCSYTYIPISIYIYIYLFLYLYLYVELGWHRSLRFRLWNVLRPRKGMYLLIFISVSISIDIATSIYRVNNPLSAAAIKTPVVGCKIPWKKTRWFREESAIFLFTRRVLAFFRVNPANSFKQPDFFPARLFWSIVGLTSGEPRETGRGGGARKQSTHRRFSYPRYLAANDASNAYNAQGVNLTCCTSSNPASLWLRDTSKRKLADFFWCFFAPPLPVSPGLPEVDPTMDQNRRSG